MSKVKTMLPEDFDPYENDYMTLEPEMVLDDDLPDRVDYAIADFNSTLHELEVYEPYHYLNDLKEYSDRLLKLINDLEKPF